MPGGAAWLERLPRLAAECAEQWSLELELPSAASNASLVVPAGDVVLKLNPPDDESEHEPDALRAWSGEGAVRLLAHDPERRALLIERCYPGTQLWKLGDDEAGDVVAGLLPRLWKPPLPQYRRLADVAARWVDEIPDTWERYGRPFEQRLLDETLSALRELGPTQGTLVTANEDLHAGNVLRAAREPWLVIDPKPIAAERDFTLVSMVRDRARGRSCRRSACRAARTTAGPPGLQPRPRPGANTPLDDRAHDRMGIRPRRVPPRACRDRAVAAVTYGYG